MLERHNESVPQVPVLELMVCTRISFCVCVLDLPGSIRERFLYRQMRYVVDSLFIESICYGTNQYYTSVLVDLLDVSYSQSSTHSLSLSLSAAVRSYKTGYRKVMRSINTTPL